MGSRSYKKHTRRMEMSDLNRREFVVAAACAAGACMMCGALAEAEPAADASAGKVDAGLISDYAKDGVYDKLADSKKILIVRQGAKLTAMTAICTHKMGTV